MTNVHEENDSQAEHASPRTIAEFASRYGITMKSEWASANPNMGGDEEWNRSASHYKVTFTRRDPTNHVRCKMTTYFSMGAAHTKEPELRDVLDCLASDAAGLENAEGDFASWCDEYGYDSDSRKAERTFKACERSAEKLQHFLGEDRFQELLFNTERE